MSYQVLARKWRPQRFNQVVGQQHVLSALENSLRENRLHHAYLFSGTRGVGKTSIARLFAKGLNCEQGVSAEPCGECQHCKAIEEGRFIDLIEIDAASRTKVEDTRELLDNVQYKPTVGRYKVYLIDEVHMLSRSSFNALLKTLEEPPEYVKFLLATTDPQKLPITILSRCMQFHLRALDKTQIQAHLEFILLQENIPFEPLAIEKLAKAAQGSLRDSLSLTDQAIAMSNANVSLAAVSQMLGLLDENQPVELLQALSLADGEKVMKIVQDVAEKGANWQQLLNDVAEILHKIAILQLLPTKNEEETALHFLARQISPEDVQFLYQVMLTGKKELPYAPEPRYGVEMTMLRALAFHPKNIEQPQQSYRSIKEQVDERSKEQSVVPVVPKEEATSVVESVQYSSANSSPAMLAIQASRQLKAQQLGIEKKKLDLTQTENRVQVKMEQSSPTNVLQSLGSFLANQDHRRLDTETIKKPAEKASVSDSDYRWTWLNPELEEEVESAKASDIKQAILQERTPELINKTVALACKQDEWSRLVNELNLSGFSRQLALNSYVEAQDEQSIKLVLKPAMAQFNNDEARHHLANALAQRGLSLEIRVGESEISKTPLEIRRSIFENLTLVAKDALFNDEKLKLLREAFDAEIDESTIRAMPN